MDRSTSIYVSCFLLLPRPLVTLFFVIFKPGVKDPEISIQIESKISETLSKNTSLDEFEIHSIE